MRKLETINIRDPYVLVQNGTYYLYASGAKDNVPGFFVYESKDMENFEEPVPVFLRTPSFWGQQDFWAPEVHVFEGSFYLFASFKAAGHCRGTSILVADNPKGPFKPITNGPVTPENWECLDGSLWVEKGVPYIIFCREWLEVKDGEMYIAQLKKDFTGLAKDPVLLFRASQAKWAACFSGKGNYVTDGPFLFRQDGYYEMLWSSFSKNGYALGLAKSKKLLSGWVNQNRPVFDADGGHGMIFQKDGKPMIILHSPNGPNGQERPKMIPLGQLI